MGFPRNTLAPPIKALKHREFGVCWLHGFLIPYKLGEELGTKDLRFPTL